MKIPVTFFLILFMVGFGSPSEAGVEEELRVISTRPGVTQSFVLIRPAGQSLASVILFSGGTGALALSSEKIAQWQPTNFLVRNRIRFSTHGLLVAVVDAPSDRSGQGLFGFRTTSAHTEDIRGVIAEMRKIAPVPVWLIGTSMGTVSAGNVAARLKEGGADGLVLTSSVTTSGRMMNESLQYVRLEDVTLPTLIVHHESDGCKSTPYGEAHALLKRLKHASRKAFLSFRGGDPPQSEPCEALSYHGFLGLDAEVVQAIAEWIRKPSKP
jgi:hypothetical protein